MNILLTLYDIQDYGGIVPHTEALIWGFQKLGHDVSLAKMSYNRKTSVSMKEGNIPEWNEMISVGWSDLPEGWDQTHFKNIDLTIHSVPVVSKRKDTAGDMSWRNIYSKCSSPQLAIIHDGNMPKIYPHLMEVVPFLEGIACVHDCAFNSTYGLDNMKVDLIPNPHIIIDPYDDVDPKIHFEKLVDILVSEWPDRDKTVMSAQTFKAWKHVDDYVRAIPRMTEHTKKILVGDGIEGRYMRSREKCKAAYHNIETGRPIWEEALEAGMDYRGVLDYEDTLALMGDSRVVLDPSWSKNYWSMGSHFNRTFVEAMYHGAIPIATELGMGRVSHYFEKDVTHVEIPADSLRNPRAYGALIEDVVHGFYPSHDKRITMMENNARLCYEHFQAEKVAQRFIDLLEERKPEGGPTISKELRDACDRKMQHFLPDEQIDERDF